MASLCSESTCGGRLVFELSRPLSDVPLFLRSSVLWGLPRDALIEAMPMLLSALMDLARDPGATKAMILGIVRVLRMKVSSCRRIKLRFLLLTSSEPYCAFWKIGMRFVEDPYKNLPKMDLKTFEEIISVQDSLNRSGSSVDLRSLVSQPSLSSLNLLTEDSRALILFAVNRIFHPCNGIRLKNRFYRLRRVRKSFRAFEAIDFVVAHLGIQDREKAVGVLEKIRNLRIIERVGFRDKPFEDGRHVWKLAVSMHQPEDNGDSACVFTDKGEKIACFRKLELMGLENLVSEIHLNIDMDSIDLQSFEFWRRDVYTVDDVQEGFCFASKSVIHPLTGSKTQSCHDEIELTRTPLDSLESDFSQLSSLSDWDVSSALGQLEEEESRDITPLSAVVDKVFCSLARPFVISLRYPTRHSSLLDKNTWKEIGDRLLVKKGDNLFQDMYSMSIFQLMNFLWKSSDVFTDSDRPFISTYSVLPVDLKSGSIQFLDDVQSLKEFDWNLWASKNKSKESPAVQSMVRSSAGAYVGAYILGVRDRHWDNILIKNGSTLMHIDFGFMLGQVPPIDAPRFSISPSMMQAFLQLDIWETFIDLACRAFVVLRNNSDIITRATGRLFSCIGFNKNHISKLINGHWSLNVHEEENKAMELIAVQIRNSASAWKTKLKAIFHNNIDPVFYTMLKNHFPPAMLAMKLVDLGRSSGAISSSTNLAKTATCKKFTKSPKTDDSILEL